MSLPGGDPILPSGHLSPHWNHSAIATLSWDTHLCKAQTLSVLMQHTAVRTPPVHLPFPRGSGTMMRSPELSIASTLCPVLLHPRPSSPGFGGRSGKGSTGLALSLLCSVSHRCRPRVPSVLRAFGTRSWEDCCVPLCPVPLLRQ